MNKENEKIDALIREALSKEEADYYDQLEQQNVIQQFAGLYQGKEKWLNVMVTIFILLALSLCIYAGFQFAAVESVKEMLVWSLVMIGSFMMISMLKIYGWMQMDKQGLVREIKRLELQVSALANQRK